MSFIRKIGIKKFLILLSVGLSFVSLLSGGIIAFTYNNNVKSITESYKETSAKSGRLIAEAIDVSYLHSKTMALLTQKDIDQLEKDMASLEELKTNFFETVNRCTKNCGKMKELFEKYTTQLKDLIDNKVMMGKNAEAVEFFIQDLSATYAILLEEVKSLSATNSEVIQSELKDAESKYRVALNIIIAASIVLIASSVFMGFIFKKTIISMLEEMSNRLNTSLNSVKNSANQIADTSHGLSEAAVEQASSIQASSQAIHEISEMINRNSENVKSSAQKSTNSQGRIEEGKQAIADMLKAMEKINQSNNRIDNEAQKNEKEFQEIVNLISQIVEKTRIINDIVFQTKLLSFNASVEAARAGEHGKGFAVVAEEVGNLATMSGNAATEINEMLETSVRRVNEIALASKESLQGLVVSGKSSVEEGNKSASKCDQVFEMIGIEASSINEMLQEIDVGTKEQAQGIVDVNGSMNELNQVTEKNSQMAQETASLASKLQDDSRSLEEVVSELNVTLNGLA